MLGQPLAPGAVGQDHGLGHDQVQRRATLADADADGFLAQRLTAARLVELEVVVGAVEIFGLAAHHFTLGFERARQPMQKAQLRPPGDAGCGRTCGHGIFKKRFGENGVELVMA